MKGRVWLGSIFLIIGFGILLHQMNLVDLSQLLSDWWPLFLIIIGIIQLVTRNNSSAATGFLFLLIGLLFLMNQWIAINLTDFIWPLIFIIIGLFIIFNRVKHEATPHEEADLNSFVLFSGTSIQSQSENFQGGSVTAIFGGAEIDLRDTIMVEEASINITTFMGGAEITVPENVQVEISGVPIFGGWEDKTKVRVEGEKSVLKINCLTIFGGVEIRN